jgi:ankyrin repeat protein
MFAVQGTNSQVAEFLLDKGARADSQDTKGWTALMYAAEWNHVSAIRLLAGKGAELNIKNYEGDTALAIAKQKSTSAEAYELLKSLGGKERAL